MKYGLPNACNQCHTNETAQWSDDHITEWYGKRRRYHFAEAFSAAQDEDMAAVKRLEIIADDVLYPMNIRALAVQHLGNHFQNSLKNQLDNYIHNLDPTMRVAAVRVSQVQSEDDINRLLLLLSDETKAVRTEAYQILMSVGDDNIPAKYKSIYKKVKAEYEEVLEYNADFPVGKFNLGNFYFNQGMAKKALEQYLNALKQDKELHFIKLNLAHCYNRLGQNDKASLLFIDYLKNEPDDASAMYSYGLLLSEMQKYDESLKMLEKAYKADANRPRVAYNIGMMYDFKGDKVKAESYLKKEIQLMNDYNSNVGLLQFYLNNRMQQKALTLARKMVKNYPEASQDLNPVIQQLEGN